jgi:hypothetical protein
MTDATAIVVGAAISGLIGVLVVFVQRRLERRHELKDQTAARLASFVAAAWNAYDDLGPLARAEGAEKEQLRRDLGTREAWDRFNAALAQVQMLDDEQVNRAATGVLHQLVRCHRLARERAWQRDAWRAEREAVLRAIADFQQAGRRSLGVAAITVYIAPLSPATG